MREHEPLVLEYRGLGGKPQPAWSGQKTILIVGASLLLLALLVCLLTILVVVCITDAECRLDLWNRENWNPVWAVIDKLIDQMYQSALAAPWYRWLEPVALVLVPLLALVVQRAQGWRRVEIGSDALRLISGLPAWLDFGPWGSWTMAYRDIVAIDLVNFRHGRVYGPTPLQPATLFLKGRVGKPARKVAVSPWYRPGEGARSKLVATATWLGIQLGTWKSAQDQQTLRGAYDALPLVEELRKRGLAVPGLAQGVGAPGDVDLFESPRMKALILATFALSLVYLFGIFLPHEHEYWVVAPELEFWLAIGLAAGASGLLWLRAATPGTERAGDTQRLHGLMYDAAGPVPQPDAASHWGYQALVSLLFGLSAAGAAFPAVPQIAEWLFRADDVVFRVRPGAGLEPVDATSGVPSFQPTQSVDFWLSRQPGTQYTLRMRKLPLGYWQYGVSAFRVEYEAYEEGRVGDSGAVTD